MGNVLFRVTEQTYRRLCNMRRAMCVQTFKEVIDQALSLLEHKVSRLPVGTDGLGLLPPPVYFEDLRTDFESGARLARRDWCSRFYIVKTEHSRFVTLSNGRISKPWEPCAEDFSRTDWYSLD